MQLNFEGMTKDEVAIMRIQEFEPPEGYHLAFSGGKDSIMIYDLAQRAGVKFKAVYNWTGIDPPELKRFVIEHYPEVTIRPPVITIWKLIEKKCMFPTRTTRYCCEFLKENRDKGKLVMTGVRWQESFKRSQRRMYEVCRRDNITRYLHPMIDWTEEEVWGYIRTNELPYCKLYDEGFKRLGCILCPMTTAKQTQFELERYPKIAKAWFNAYKRIWNPEKSKFKTLEENWQWWLSRKGSKNDAQCTMFHD